MLWVGMLHFHWAQWWSLNPRGRDFCLAEMGLVLRSSVELIFQAKGYQAGLYQQSYKTIFQVIEAFHQQFEISL